MKLDIYGDMGESVSGIGYQWSDADGPTGSRITSGITSPSSGIYAALQVTPPAGTIGVTWSDDTGLKTAFAPVEGALAGEESPHETARRLIVEHFTDNWPDTFPVGQENQPIPERADVWGMLTVQQAETQDMVVGPGHERAPGAVFLSVFIQAGAGTKAATDAADWMRNNFDNRQLRSGRVVVVMRNSGMIDAGPRNGYVQKNIVCRFHRDCYPQT